MPLEGKLVTLREERADDLPFLAGLRNDLDTQAWPKTLPPDYTEPMYRKRFEACEFSFDRADARFIIIHKESDERAGAMVYNSLEPRFAVTIGIMVAKKFWSAGVALDAQETMLRFLFVELGVRVARLWTHSGNPRMVKLAEKSGFKISMRRRQAVFKNGELCDNLAIDLLREEYFARRPELKDELPAL